MPAKVCSAAINGIEAYPVEVEVNAGYGDAVLVIVGLPVATVKESRDGYLPGFQGVNLTLKIGGIAGEQSSRGSFLS